MVQTPQLMCKKKVCQKLREDLEYEEFEETFENGTYPYPLSLKEGSAMSSSHVSEGQSRVLF